MLNRHFILNFLCIFSTTFYVYVKTYHLKRTVYTRIHYIFVCNKIVDLLTYYNVLIVFEIITMIVSIFKMKKVNLSTCQINTNSLLLNFFRDQSCVFQVLDIFKLFWMRSRCFEALELLKPNRILVILSLYFG